MALVEKLQTPEKMLERLGLALGHFEQELRFSTPISAEEIVQAVNDIVEGIDKRRGDAMVIVPYGKVGLSPFIVGMNCIWEPSNVVVVAKNEELFLVPGKEYTAIFVRNLHGGPGENPGNYGPYDDIRRRAVEFLAKELDCRLDNVHNPT